jgi:transaldolase
MKIAGTPAGLVAIEEAIFLGIPVKVTLLFSRAQYLAAAEAYMRGVERRIEAGLNPLVGSVASIFVSRWDMAVADVVPAELKNRLGIAMAHQIYKAYRGLLSSPRWQRAFNAGARPQRVLWASTGTKDPEAPDTLYVKALTAPFTINTMPEATLKAFADHGQPGPLMGADGGTCEEMLKRFNDAGVEFEVLAERLQTEGAENFVRVWNELMGVIESKSRRLAASAQAITEHE